MGFVEYHTRDCELCDLEVYEVFQRQGIGTRLFQKAMQDLKLHGCNEMNWVATESSIPFYLQQGAHLSTCTYPNLGLVRMYRGLGPEL